MSDDLITKDAIEIDLETIRRIEVKVDIRSGQNLVIETDDKKKFTFMGLDAKEWKEAIIDQGKNLGVSEVAGDIYTLLDSEDIKVPLQASSSLEEMLDKSQNEAFDKDADDEHGATSVVREEMHEQQDREALDAANAKQYLVREQHETQRKQEESERIDKLRKIIKVSTSLPIARLADLLKVDEKFIWDNIIDWAEKFGFTIDNDKVVFGHGSINAFIDDLDKTFSTWDEKTKYKDSKI